MESVSWFETEFLDPRFLFEVAVAFGREVAHSIPVPDQLGWLISAPLVFVPMAFIAVAYTIGYVFSWGCLYGGETVWLWLEWKWITGWEDIYIEKVGEEYRRRVDEALPGLPYDPERGMRYGLDENEDIPEQRLHGTGAVDADEGDESGVSFRQ